MLKLVNAKDGEAFLISTEKIVSVTQHEGKVMVWVDLEKQIGYEVKDSFAYITEALWAQ